MKIQSIKSNTNLLVFFDQLIVSGGNFLLSIIILRFLGTEAFGIFSFLWLFIFFFNSVQLSLIISPIMTNFPKINEHRVSNYLGGVFLQQLVLSILFVIVAYLFIFFFDEKLNKYNFSSFFNSFIVSIFFIQIQQFFRRVLFLKKKYLLAIISDLVSFTTLFTLISYFILERALNLNLLIWILGFSFFLGTLICISIIFKFKISYFSFFDSFNINWSISRWLFLTSLLQWFSGNLWIINTGIILGPYYLGVLRACQTIIGITNLAFQSFENLFPLKFSEIFITKGKKSLNKYLIKFIRDGIIYIFLFILLISIFSKDIINFFYGKEIANYNQILIYLSLILPLTFLIFPISYILRTLNKTRPIFFGYLLSSIFAIIFSKYIISDYELFGSILGLFMSSLIILLTIIYSYRKNIL